MRAFRELVRFFIRDLFRGDWITMPDHLRAAFTQLFGLAVAFAFIFPMQIVRGAFTRIHTSGTSAQYHGLSDLTLHFFLIVIMILAGLLCALKWPSLFPSREDHLVLSPLPLERWQIFLAKLAALTVFIGIFVLGLTTMAAFVIPILSTGRYETVATWRRGLAFFTAGLAAGFATLWSLAALQGVAALVLPGGRAFRIFSAFVQSLLLFAILLSIPFLLQVPAPHPNLPSAWFLGLIRQLEGRPGYATPASAATLTFAISLVTMLGAYLISYWRQTRQILETLPLASAPRFGGGDGLFGFFWKTLTRSPAHRTLFLGILALALVFVLDTVVATASHRRFRGFNLDNPRLNDLAMSAALSILYLAIAGLRLIFRLPFELRARWIFRFLDDPLFRRQQLLTVERAYYAIAFLPLIGFSFFAKAILFSPLAALRMAAVEAALGALVIELAQRNLANLPFTLPYVPGRGHIIQSLAFYGLGLAFMALAGGRMVHAALHYPEWSLIWPATLGGFALFLRRTRLDESEHQVWLTEENLGSEITTLEIQA